MDMSNLAYEHYRQASGLETAERESNLTQVTARLRSDDVQTLDAIAKFLGTSRNTFLSDLTNDALMSFISSFLDHCVENDDKATMGRFIEAIGWPASTVEKAFESRVARREIKGVKAK